MIHFRLAMTCVVALLVSPQVADAQSIARSFDVLRTQERPGRMHVSGPLMLASLAGGPALGRLLDRPGIEAILYRAPNFVQP